MSATRRILTASLFSIIFVGAFLFAGSNASARIFPEPLTYEVITVHGYLRGAKGILMNVESGGCTNQSQFAFEILRDQSLIAKVQVLRIKNDYCLRYMPLGQKLYFEYAKMGLRPDEDFVIVNPDPGTKSEKIFPGIR
jgi:hypothetical protein